MNPRPSSNSIQVAIRIPGPWLEKADLVARMISTPGRQASRTDVLRDAIAAGIDLVGQSGSSRMASEPAFQERMWKRLLEETALVVRACNVKGLKAEVRTRHRVIILTDGETTRTVNNIESLWQAAHDWPSGQFQEYFFKWALDESLSLEAYLAERQKKKSKK